jgi:hypothetical protein
VKIAIVSHYSRDKWTIGLVNSLIVQNVVNDPTKDIKVLRDDGTIGAKANHMRAIEWIAGQNDDCHGAGLVLEDDVVVCEDFGVNLDGFRSRRPEPVGSLYLGRGRPPQYQERIASVIGQDVSYITADVLMSAQGYTMPLWYFQEALDEMCPLASPHLPIDEHLTYWLQHKDHRVSYPKYSLIDHRDGPTLIEDHGDGQPRNGTTALCVENCDPSGARLPEVRKAWLLAGHNTAWDLGSIPLPEGAPHETAAP